VRALACPASLKGVLGAAAAAAALAEGLRAGGAAADECPVADGGEGTMEVLRAALGGDWRETQASDPLGRPVRARWLALRDGTAVVESAEVLGLHLLAPQELDPLVASSRGLGELILTVEASALLVALGGSATVDGGAGMRAVLRRLDVPTRVLCDVRTRLGDAARLYGPQKGADEAAVVELEARLAGMRDLQPYAELPGSGAAGGLGAAFAALGAELVPGAATVLELIGFERRIRGASLVVTGEGTVDATTAEGKAPAEVARVCAAAGVRCVVFGGRVVDGADAIALSGDPARAREDLVQLGRRLATGASAARG
jgi:glycerate 2-kinase